MDNVKEKSAKMGNTPIGKLLLSMSLPAMFSMLIQSLYNVVDSIFVARISEDALNAVSIAFPMQMLVLSFGIGIGVGTNAIVSRRLGEKDRDNASMCAQTGIFMALVTSALFLLVGYPLSMLYFKGFASGAVYDMGVMYLSIVICMSFGQIIEMTCSKIIQATGNMIIPMISQLIGAVTNIVFDPLLIFGIGFFPKMGIAGAAVATVMGQIFSMIFVLVSIKVKKHEIHIFFHKFEFRKKNFAVIFRVGIPALVMNAISAFTTIFMNAILQMFNKKAVTVLGVYFKLQSFVFMPVFGLTQGMLPILGYNYGAKNKKRFDRTFLLSSIVAIAIMVVGTLIFQLAPSPLMKLFNAEGELLDIGIKSLRAISWSFIGAAFGIVITTMFQSIGKGFASLLMSLLRQVIFILPLSLLLGKFAGGIDALWFSYPISEYLTLAIFAPVAYFSIRKAFGKNVRAAIPIPDNADLTAAVSIASINDTGDNEISE